MASGDELTPIEFLLPDDDEGGMASSSSRSSSDRSDPTLKLARGARTGDPRSIAALYQRLLPALHAWVRLRVADSVRQSLDADDIIQEIWVRLLEIMPRYDARLCGFRAWVFKVAKNVLLEQCRAARRVAPPPGRVASGSRRLERVAAELTSASRRVARSETLERFLSRAATLDPEARQLLVNCGLEGMPLADAARRLGISRDAAAKRWQRLKKQVRGWACGQEMIE